MGEKAARINTSLTVKECAEVFRSSPKQLMSGAAKMQGLVARISGGVFTADFFTPEESGPFAALDDDAPTFSAGTFIRNGAAAANPTELHMYVWDRGERREILIMTSHGLVSGQVHARTILRKLSEMFAAHDPQAQVALDV